MRLFVGIFLPDHLINHITEIQEHAQQLGIEARYVEPKNLHITVAFLGKITSPVEDIIEKLDTISFPAFNAHLKELELIKQGPHRALLWLSVTSQELIELSQRIKVTLELPPEPHSKKIPHITLARIQTLKNIEKLLSFAENTEVDQAPFRIDSFDIITSHLGANGPRYMRLKRFSLEK